MCIRDRVHPDHVVIRELAGENEAALTHSAARIEEQWRTRRETLKAFKTLGERDPIVVGARLAKNRSGMAVKEQ